jgi:hypothetical protein
VACPPNRASQLQNTQEINMIDWIINVPPWKFIGVMVLFASVIGGMVWEVRRRTKPIEKFEFMQRAGDMYQEPEE